MTNFDGEWDLETSHLLSASVTPVAMISACGLIALALYNRLAAILTRIRAFQQSKYELLINTDGHEVDVQELLLHMLDQQIGKVTSKARMIQKGLFSLLGSMAAFLLCSLLAGATALHEELGNIALGLGIFGVALFLQGIFWAMTEVFHSLAPLAEENAYLEALATQRRTQMRSRELLKIAKRA